jgi:dynein light chain roadblock-type
LLSRQSGAIVRTSGLISKSSSVNPNSSLPASVDDTDGYTNDRQESGLQSAEDVARLVFSFVESAGVMVNGLDNEEEVRLLRVRTKKNELVIVPSEQDSRCARTRLTTAGAKFILVAIHDTPPA